VKCTSCSGALSLDNFLICPYCGIHQEIDLTQVHFRNLGNADGMTCPRCPDQEPVLERVGLALREQEDQRPQLLLRRVILFECRD
jgi:hypothetical protein